MKKKQGDLGGSRGSLTVEALLFLIPFMMAFCTLINGARFVQAEMLIHHAVTQTAKQISTYSYVLTKTKISEKMQKSHKKSERFKTNIEKATSSIEGFTEAIGDSDSLMDDIFSLVKSEGEKEIMGRVAGEIAKKNIEKTLSLLTDDPDGFLKNLGIVDGMSGLFFSESEWVSNTGGKGNVKIVATYTMENILFPDFNFGRHEFCQCAYTLIW